jgi:hypothetical protein
MIKVKYFSKKCNKIITNEYDYQNYVKPLYCSCCDTMIHSNTVIFHKKTEFHKIAQHLRSIIPEPIDDIKKRVLEYKMVKKYMNKTFNNDSSSNSEHHDEIENKEIDEKTLKRIQRKSETYKRELDHRAERYEKTKGISMLVDTIKTTTKRLTKLQIEKYNNYLIKYPDNELLLSIQHLVPPHGSRLMLDTNVPKNE